MKPFRLNLDALGVCASSLCMVHCLVFPLLLAALPLLNLSSEERVADAAVVATGDQPKPSQASVDTGCAEEAGCPESQAATPETNSQHAACCATPTDYWIHVGLFASVAPLGLVAWGMGYRRHRQLGVLALGLAGVVLLAGAILFGTQLLGGRGEQIMTVLGSICMVSAHLWNRRQCQCCRTPDLAAVVEMESRASESRPVPLATEGVS